MEWTNCLVDLLVPVVCMLPMAWAMRSMIVGGAGILWWLAGPGAVAAGIAAGCLWSAHYPVPLNQEDRPAIVEIQYLLFCFVCTTALLWIYSVILLVRFGLWPRSPEHTRGFPIIANGPTDPPQPPLTKH